MTYDIFLSYRHVDGVGSTTNLATLLTERNVSAYLDEKEIPPGTPISHSVASAIAWPSVGMML
jgi:hypothetical protein